MIHKINNASKGNYDERELNVIHAFFNPKFLKSRTITGLAFDSGLRIDEVQKCLAEMKNNGEAKEIQEGSKKVTSWTMTEEGRRKFSALRPKFEELNLVYTDVE